MDETVPIPRRLAEYKRGDKSLFVAITKASYVVAGPIGSEFIYMFEDGIPLGAALSNMRAKYGKERESEIRVALTDLLTQIETRQFYQHARPREAMAEQTMLIRLTNRCNLRCTHCLVSSSPDWPKENELSTDEWLAAVEQFAAFTSERGFSKRQITVTGGEALVRQDALEIAHRSKSLGMYTVLYSNGVSIASARVAAAIASAVDELQISFDGATAEVHDAVRGSGMFVRSIRGVDFLREAGVRFHIAVVVMPQNYDDLLLNLGALVRRLGECFVVKLGMAVKEGRATEDMMFRSIAEGEDQIRILIDRLASEGVRAASPFTPNLKNTSCGYARELTVDENGLVYGCGPRQFPIGNLKTESFLSIAERVIGNSRGAEVDLVEGCRDCNIRYLCGGTCRLNNIARMGRATISSCDQAEKERRIGVLFGRAANIVPVKVLVDSLGRLMEARTPTFGVTGHNVVPLSALFQTS
jgi:radical SAM protein with 4Fe4S-binding SPASM domain